MTKMTKYAYSKWLMLLMVLHLNQLINKNHDEDNAIKPTSK